MPELRKNGLLGGYFALDQLFEDGPHNPSFFLNEYTDTSQYCSLEGPLQETRPGLFFPVIQVPRPVKWVF